MTSYDTMLPPSAKRGCTLSGETLVDAELAAYAAALDVLCERLEALQKDSFLCTAGEEGISRWEALFGLQIQVPWKNGERRCCSAALSITIRIPAAIF